MSFRVEVRGDYIDIADEVLAETAPIAKERMNVASRVLLDHVRRRLSANDGPAPAAPGESPAYQRGDLFRSFRTIASTIRGRVVRGGVASDDPGAAAQEFGWTTEAGRLIPARPYVRPAEIAAEPEVARMLETGL